MERDIKPTYDELESYVENLQKQLADAQATIAALEETILKMGENAAVVAKDAMAAKEQVAALQAQVKELEQWVQDQSTANLETMRHMDEMQSRALEAEQQLTQRTAELEAAKASQAIDLKNNNAYREQVATLQAELERVRGELAHAKKMEAVQKEVADNQTWHVQKLRTLIAALPKVEGEINERFCTGSYYSSPRDYRTHVTFEAALVALLKHRQGMEG